MTIIQKIEDALKEREGEGIRPSLLVINTVHERELFTEGHAPKEISVEDYIMEKFSVELFVITTPKITEPQAYGAYKLEV